MNTRITYWVTRGRLGALAAAAIALSVPSSAQRPEGIPAEVLEPSREAAEFFSALDELARRGDPLPDFPQELAGQMESVIAESFIRGEHDGEWTRRGVDVHSEVGVLSGGHEGNALESTGPFGSLYMLLVDEPLDTVAPRGWSLVGSYGDVHRNDVIQTEFAAISPKLVLVERVGYRRVGNALCRERAQSRIYANPAVDATEFDTIAFFASHYTLLYLDRNRSCRILVPSGSGNYRDQAFDEQGYRLPGLDKNEPYSVVPRSSAPGGAPDG